MLWVGETAPDFTLSDEQGNPVTLSQYRGKNPVVLVFYPMDGTSVCTAQLCEFRDTYEELTSQGFVVFGVNPGTSASHQQFVEKQRFPFRLLVDGGKKVAQAYQTVIGWGILSLTNRSVYVVGKSGKIIFAQPGKPSPQTILSTLSGSSDR